MIRQATMILGLALLTFAPTAAASCSVLAVCAVPSATISGATVSIQGVHSAPIGPIDGYLDGTAFFTDGSHTGWYYLGDSCSTTGAAGNVCGTSDLETAHTGVFYCVNVAASTSAGVLGTHNQSITVC